MTVKAKRKLGRKRPQESGVPIEDEGGGPLRFERRCSPRWPLETSATCFQLGGDDFGRMCPLRIIDYSDGGIGAESDAAIHPGAMVSIGFESRNLTAKRGVVVNCRPCGRGYRVAVRFEQRMAA